MRRNFSKLSEDIRTKGERLNNAWYRLIATSEAHLNFLSEKKDEMIPGYWYDSEGRIVEGPDIYDAIADGII